MDIGTVSSDALAALRRRFQPLSHHESIYALVTGTHPIKRLKWFIFFTSTDARKGFIGPERMEKRNDVPNSGIPSSCSYVRFNIMGVKPVILHVSRPTS